MSEGLRRWKPQPSTVIACVALFVALAGSAYAATAKIGKNKVKSKHIKDGQVFSVDIADLGVATVDLADGAVATTKLADGSVTTAKIADNAVNSAKVAADSLTAADLANNSVGTGEIADNAVNAAKIGADQVGSSEIASDVVSGDELVQSHIHSGNVVTVNDGTSLDGDWQLGAVSTATCGINETILSAHLVWTTGGDELATHEIIIDPTGDGTATGRGISDDGGAQDYRVDAVCIVE